MGKPVVASNITGASELLHDGENGMLIPLGNTDKFAGSILGLIKDPELRKTMGGNAHKSIVDNFSIEKYINGVETVFAEILG